MVSISSSDSGKAMLTVSGKMITRTPATRLKDPMITIGIVTGEIDAKIGAPKLPSLENIDAVPSAVFLIDVGYNSMVKRYAVAKAAVPPNFPM